MHDLLLGIPGLGPEGLRKLAEFWAHGGAKAGVPPPQKLLILTAPNVI